MIVPIGLLFYKIRILAMWFHLTKLEQPVQRNLLFNLRNISGRFIVIPFIFKLFTVAKPPNIFSSELSDSALG